MRALLGPAVLAKAPEPLWLLIVITSATYLPTIFQVAVAWGLIVVSNKFSKVQTALVLLMYDCKWSTGSRLALSNFLIITSGNRYAGLNHTALGVTSIRPRIMDRLDRALTLLAVTSARRKAVFLSKICKADITRVLPHLQMVKDLINLPRGKELAQLNLQRPPNPTCPPNFERPPNLEHPPNFEHPQSVLQNIEHPH